MAKESTMQRHLFLSIIAIILLVLAFTTWRHTKKEYNPKSVPLKQGLILSSPRSLKPFELIDSKGHMFSQKNFRGHWNLLFFGFTHCPGICPATMAKLNKAYHYLKQQQVQPLPKIIFISIDPERDSPEKIQQYVNTFNKNFIGVTGNEEELEKLTKQLGIYHTKATTEENNYYISHSGNILIVNPSGAWVAQLSPPLDGKIIAQDFLQIKHYFKPRRR